MSTKLPPAAADFIERLGLATQAEGLPRIAGRLMAVLLLLDRACTLEELTRRLGVSHGSVDSGYAPPPGKTSRGSAKPTMYSPSGDSARRRVPQYVRPGPVSLTSNHVSPERNNAG